MSDDSKKLTEEEKQLEAVREHRKTVKAIDDVTRVRKYRNRFLNKGKFQQLIKDIEDLIDVEDKNKLPIIGKIDKKKLAKSIEQRINKFIHDAYDDDMIGDAN